MRRRIEQSADLRHRMYLTSILMGAEPTMPVDVEGFETTLTSMLWRGDRYENPGRTLERMVAAWVSDADRSPDGVLPTRHSEVRVTPRSLERCIRVNHRVAVRRIAVLGPHGGWLAGGGPYAPQIPDLWRKSYGDRVHRKFDADTLVETVSRAERITLC